MCIASSNVKVLIPLYSYESQTYFAIIFSVTICTNSKDVIFIQHNREI